MTEKEGNTCAVANGAAQVGLESCDMRAVTLRGCLMIKKRRRTPVSLLMVEHRWILRAMT